MSDLIERFKQNWGEHFAAPAPHTYLLAVSGGVDSMVMCDLFLKAGLSVAVAHCNFQLRGEEANLDEKLVRDWCLAHSITFHSTRFDTGATAADWKKGIQETARILRYDWFELLRKEYKYTAIATAHHTDDNVETLLINLFRGTGIKGLHGILPKNGYIIRPLLFAAKDDLLAYAKERNVPYRNDASNESADYSRNAIRLKILPAIEEFFPKASININESAGRFAEAEMLYNKAMEQERKKLVEQRGNDYYIPVLKLKNRKPLGTILYELLEPFGFSPAQLPQAIQLIQAESGHYMVSPTHRLIRDRDFLIITTLPAASAGLVVIDSAPCQVDTAKFRFSFSIQDKPEIINPSQDIAYLDLKEITFPLYLRKWRIGDYFYPFGMDMKKKKVSRVLINEKIPLHEKEDILVLESNKRIVWLTGIRPDERFRVKDATQKVLVVKRAPTMTK